MDTLSIFKFWKTNKSKIAVTDTTSDGDSCTIVSDPIIHDFSEDDNDDDSFFELELTLPKFNPKPSQIPQKTTEPNNLAPKPQSPISILRSASPNLKIFMFGKKLKSTEPTLSETDNFTVKFKIEDGSIVPKFTRANSENQLLLLKNKNESKQFLSFSFGNKTRKSSGGEERRISSSSVTETYSFPSPIKEKMSRFKVKRKELGKSKSASAIVVLPTNNLRNDYPCDGIESAILHCKRSLDSTPSGKSALSRCSSDPSHEKSITLSEDQL